MGIGGGLFTGIIAAVGRVATVQSTAGGVRLRIEAGGLALDDVRMGDSIAVNGVCLTAIALDAASFETDVSRETLGCTAGFAAGSRVNLEKALRLMDRLGGHLVSGHVDGVGMVSHCEPVGDNRLMRIAAPAAIARYIARKGSIAVNGVSLTVNDATAVDFAVNVIPHTLAATNLGETRAGDRVNLEVDLIARHVERLLQSDGRA
jgi:riboflavin synthase